MPRLAAVSTTACRMRRCRRGDARAAPRLLPPNPRLPESCSWPLGGPRLHQHTPSPSLHDRAAGAKAPPWRPEGGRPRNVSRVKYSALESTSRRRRRKTCTSSLGAASCAAAMQGALAPTLKATEAAHGATTRSATAAGAATWSRGCGSVASRSLSRSSSFSALNLAISLKASLCNSLDTRPSSAATLSLSATPISLRSWPSASRSLSSTSSAPPATILTSSFSATPMRSPEAQVSTGMSTRTSATSLESKPCEDDEEDSDGRYLAVSSSSTLLSSSGLGESVFDKAPASLAMSEWHSPPSSRSGIRGVSM
mmetsp:Transcript_67085/g.187676  ORF Transcript_67085/g.187676 Transcript_67085/m.187676 type:complete len:311 (+) Transcript_67085:135-1067(+)